MASWKLSSKAQSDLDRLDDYILERFGVQTAEQKLKEFYDTAAYLARNPYLGRTWQETEYRGYLFNSRTWVVYKVQNEGVYILRLFDARTNPENWR
jgi:Plasmid stabilization system protein